MHSESQAVAPGRPLGFDPEAALDRLTELFWERGYDQVSQQQMAAATGLSTSSLYNTFGTKADTFRAVLRRYADRIFTLVEPLEQGRAGREDILATLDRMLEHLRTPGGREGCLIASAMVTLTGRDPEVEAVGGAYRTRMQAAFAAAVDRGRALGEPLPPADVTAPVLTAAVLGVMVTARATAAGPETFAQVEAMRALVAGWA